MLRIRKDGKMKRWKDRRKDAMLRVWKDASRQEGWKDEKMEG